DAETPREGLVLAQSVLERDREHRRSVDSVEHGIGVEEPRGDDHRLPAGAVGYPDTYPVRPVREPELELAPTESFLVRSVGKHDDLDSRRCQQSAVDRPESAGSGDDDGLHYRRSVVGVGTRILPGFMSPFGSKSRLMPW